MKKKVFKSLFAAASLLCSIPVSAYDFEVDGVYYDIVSMNGFTCKVVKESSKSLYKGNIVIPSTISFNNKTLTVIEIADKVFKECSDLTGITIPSTISLVGDEMFNGCTKLEYVKIEDGETVLEIGNFNKYNKGLFAECPITTLYIGRNLSYATSDYYGLSPFRNIKTIKELTIYKGWC